MSCCQAGDLVGWTHFFFFKHFTLIILLTLLNFKSLHQIKTLACISSKFYYFLTNCFCIQQHHWSIKKTSEKSISFAVSCERGWVLRPKRDVTGEWLLTSRWFNGKSRPRSGLALVNFDHDPTKVLSDKIKFLLGSSLRQFRILLYSTARRLKWFVAAESGSFLTVAECWNTDV